MKVTKRSAAQAVGSTEPVAAELNVELKAEATITEPVTTVGDEFRAKNATTAVALDRTQASLPAAASSSTSATRDAVLGQGRDRNGVGNGLNGSGGHLASARGRIPASSWDQPERILGRLTQTPAGGSGGNSLYRCAPANLLGQAVMNGPAATSQFLRNVAQSTPPGRLTDAERRDLRDIATAVDGRTATFDQLSRAQGLLYKAGNSRTDAPGALRQAIASGRLNAAERREAQAFITRLDNNDAISTRDGERMSTLLTKAFGQEVRVRGYDDPQHPGDASRRFVGVEVGGRLSGGDRSGFGDDEVAGLGTLGGARGRNVDFSSTTLRDVLRGLRPGEAATLRVAGTEGGENADHFVTIGRRPDGTAYLYNPDPARGDYTLFTGGRGDVQPQAFLDQLQRVEDRTAIDPDGDTPSALVHSPP